jgi:hypothetical protein
MAHTSTHNCLSYTPLVGFWWGNLKERDHWGDPGVDERIILRQFSGSGMWEYGLD